MTPFYIGNSSKIKTKIIRKEITCLNFVLLFLFLIIIGIYLVEMNAMAAFGYQIQNLKTRVDELNSANQLLEIESYKLGSMDSLSLLSDELEMVKISQVDYIVPIQSTVAAK